MKRALGLLVPWILALPAWAIDVSPSKKTHAAASIRSGKTAETGDVGYGTTVSEVAAVTSGYPARVISTR